MNITNEVEVLVNDMIDNDKLFTAYDITKALRAKFPQINIHHAGVRSIINDIYDAGKMIDYCRTQTDVTRADVSDGSTVMVNVFHSLSDDADSYEFGMYDKVGGISGIVPSLIRAVNPSSTNIVTNIGATQSVCFKMRENIDVTNESRLNIPPRMLQAIGAKCGDDIVVVVDQNDKLVCRLLTASTLTSDGCTLYKVNVDGRIRISDNILSNLVNNLNSCYTVTVTNDNAIEVE